MKNLLIIIPKPPFHSYLPPVGFAYLLGVLKEKGFDFRVIDNNCMNYGADKISSLIKRHHIDIVLMSTVYRFHNNCPTITINQSLNLAMKLKREFHDLKTILIGPFTYLYKEKLLYAFDYLVRGEFEEIVGELMEYLVRGNGSIGDVSGVVYKENDVIKETDKAPFPDLSKLPIPDRSFCFSARDSIKNKDNYGKAYRVVPEEKTIEELKQLKRDYRIKGFKIEDIEFCADKGHVERLCRLIIRNNLDDLAWRAVTRVTSLDYPLLRLMRQAGCRSIYYGVESGSEEVLRRTRKGISLEKIEATFELTNKAGIQPDASFLFGVPGDTPATIEETIAFSKKIGAGFTAYHIFTPFPGIPLLSDNDLIDFEAMDKFDVYSVGVPKSFCSMSLRELKKYKKIAYAKYYLDPGFINKFARKIFTSDLLKYMVSVFLRNSEANFALKLILGVKE
jgi:anaerobic magnesium-protoporphyrin IX monomethyl ester cyclase